MRIKNILQYLERTATRLGDKTAFSAGNGGEELTFSALLATSRAIGSALLARMLRGQRVAILMERRPMTIAAMFGVWYAGGVSIVPDSGMPDARMRDVLSRAGVSCIITDARSLSRAGSFGIPVLGVEDAVGAPIDAVTLAKVRREQIDTDPLYIVFTSGSTGSPKGVIAPHRSLIDYAEALTEALSMDESAVLGCQSPLYFDAPFKEILSTIVCGATTYLIPARCFSFPMLLLRYLEEHAINTVCWVVSAFLQISALGALEDHPPLTLKKVVFGSEVFPREHYDRWRSALPDATFYQLYGPTEATGMSCVWRADRALSPEEKIPIGAPLDNTDALLIDESGKKIGPVEGAESEAGEIYLRGSCVTLGYDHAAEETSAVFVQNPLHDAYPEIVYRTGDLARYNPRGELVFLGRRDAQIKHMGHRIEPGDVEEAAMRVPGVREAGCVYMSEQRALVLFYVGDTAEQSVTATLRSRLPQYMLPRWTFCLTALPRTPNGKKDRRAMLAMACEKHQEIKNKEM